MVTPISVSLLACPRVSPDMVTAELVVEHEVSSVSVPGLRGAFKDVLNLFNDPLPTKEWFDLKSVLSKYELLREVDVTINSLTSWKVALENIHVLFGSYHKQVLELQEVPELIQNLFQWPTFPSSKARVLDVWQVECTRSVLP